MRRTPKVEKFVDNFTQKIFGQTIKEAVGDSWDGVCVTCGNDRIARFDFRDELSLKEFHISGMCQKCQDSVFGV